MHLIRVYCDQIACLHLYLTTPGMRGLRACVYQTDAILIMAVAAKGPRAMGRNSSNTGYGTSVR